MVRSMTAYGRAQKSKPSGRWVVEIHSVNRKGLDFHFSLPSELLFLEGDLRKWIAGVIYRGTLTIRVARELEGASSSHYVERLLALQEKWHGIAHALHYSKEEITIPFLLKMAETENFFPEKTEELKKDLFDVAKDALAAYVAMKEEEGRAIAADIEKRSHILTELLEQVKAQSGEGVKKYRDKLAERLEAFSGTAGLDQLLVREVALLAEKVDITEELVRFAIHVTHLRKTLKETGESVGRKLDFLLQEMNREVSTMAAKNGDESSVLLFVEMKSEMEKMREQVQNIE